MCLPLSSCAKLDYVPFGQNKSDPHMFHIEIFALRIIILEADDEVQRGHVCWENVKLS